MTQLRLCLALVLLSPGVAAAELPFIDLDAATERQVIVDQEPGQYLGHPSTLLLEDGKTILCVYPKGHGRGAIVYKRSTDGGLTWSDRLPTPETWATSLETPTLHRVVDEAGTKRVIMFSGLYPVRMAVSEDDGETWSELQAVGDWGGIVTMGSVVELKTGPGQYLALFHDDGRFFRANGERTATMTLYQSRSLDGGLTWSQPETIYASDQVHLCEPGAIRSPDGKQIAVLLRENRRVKPSHLIVSDDEGKTWSEPGELPLSLTGDRHTAKYAPDGRLFISFRDVVPKGATSPTAGDWVGWVGTYEDIIEGREGQYRVRLKDNHQGADCAYPGVEVLPDGTFVTTTYGHWIPGEQPYILSVRFQLEELDALVQAKRMPQPNVLFILSDDQRPDTIHALGNEHIKTPNLDRLVHEGFVFNRAFCMGSTIPAVCSPSRCMLMTGQTLFHLPPLNAKQVGPEVPLFPRAMGQAGYATLRTGKTGNHPKFADNEFDQNFDIRRSLTCTTQHADNAIAFIEEQAQTEGPFFLYVAFAMPHDPRIGPQEYMDMYEPGDVPLPANYLPVHPFDNGEMTVRDEKLAPWPRTQEVVAEHLADYYSVITYMDAEIGRILAALEESGEYENTIIIFSSDHGLAIGSHGLFGKQNLYEHSMGVPLIFAGPGIPAGQSTDAFAYLLDIFPTVCELTGTPIPDGVEGKSLAPILHGEAESVRESVFTAYRDVQRAVRNDRWKLIRYPRINRSELFDMKNDPQERHDLAKDPDYAEHLNEMTALLERWQQELDDPTPLTSAKPSDPAFMPPTEP